MSLLFDLFACEVSTDPKSHGIVTRLVGDGAESYEKRLDDSGQSAVMEDEVVQEYLIGDRVALIENNPGCDSSYYIEGEFSDREMFDWLTANAQDEEVCECLALGSFEELLAASSESFSFPNDRDELLEAIPLTEAERYVLADDGQGEVRGDLQFIYADATEIDEAALQYRIASEEGGDDDRDVTPTEAFEAGDWTLSIDHPSFEIKGERGWNGDAFFIRGDRESAGRWLKGNFPAEWARELGNMGLVAA